MTQNYERYLQIMPIVMLHGDTWSNNIFFERNEETGEIGHKVLAFIDWQISFAGCGLSDLSRFSTICVHESLRVEFEKDVVRRYFDR